MKIHSKRPALYKRSCNMTSHKDIEIFTAVKNVIFICEFIMYFLKKQNKKKINKKKINKKK